MRLAAHNRDRALETLARDPSCQACEIVRDNILGVNVTAWSNPPSQPHRVIAAPRAYVGHDKTGVHAEQVHNVLCFARPVARFLIPPNVGNDPRDRATRPKFLLLRAQRRWFSAAPASFVPRSVPM